LGGRTAVRVGQRAAGGGHENGDNEETGNDWGFHPVLLSRRKWVALIRMITPWNLFTIQRNVKAKGPFLTLRLPIPAVENSTKIGTYAQFKAVMPKKHTKSRYPILAGIPVSRLPPCTPVPNLL
jgi:hypothetical protein